MGQPDRYRLGAADGGFSLTGEVFPVALLPGITSRRQTGDPIIDAQIKVNSKNRSLGSHRSISSSPVMSFCGEVQGIGQFGLSIPCYLGTDEQKHGDAWSGQSVCLTNKHTENNIIPKCCPGFVTGL